jgi:hypothetical protein
MLFFSSMKNPVDLSLLTKLWIVYLLETLSSWSLRRNFLWQFPEDAFNLGVKQKLDTALKYNSQLQNSLLINFNEEQTANGAHSCRLLLKNHKQFLTYESLC